MITIDELVNAVYFEYSHALPREGQYGYETCIRALRKIATEQDRIARQEERERCIKAAQEWHCTESCWGYDKDNRICKGCDFWGNIRKAIEEGGEG